MSGWEIPSWDEAARDCIDIEERVIEDKALRRKLKNERMTGIIAGRLNDLCGIPAKGEEFLISTEKAFNAYACIRSLLEGGDIDELYIAIYRINQPTVQALSELVEDGRIRKATFIISSFFLETKKPETWAMMLMDYCEKRPDVTRFAYLHNHSKVMCARKGDDYYYFEGSGNMSDNARIEQYRYGNSKEVYDFHTGWMESCIDYFNGKRK